MSQEKDCLMFDISNEKEEKSFSEEFVISLQTKVCELEKTITLIKQEHENVTSEVAAMITEMGKMKKEDGLRKNEMKHVKDENVKLISEIGLLQCEKDKLEAKYKAEVKIIKIKENTKIFNKILEKQIMDGDIINVDISKYKDSEMEECDGGEHSKESTGYGSLQNLVKNKLLGGKRTSPQANPDLKRKNEEKKQVKLFKCSQFDFLAQNETYFNEHMGKVHAGQPICPFCYISCDDYPSLRKHCESRHKEIRSEKVKNIPEGRKRPCRFFRNGEGWCSPRTGTCEFDHTIIPDHERELCFHKQACTYKPYCIFNHPEGQGDKWQ